MAQITMTIPNLITSLRIILAPIFVIYLINDRFLPALLVFVLAGLSDGADGLVARLFDQKSKLGSYLDPLADKILLVTAFVVLAARGFIPSWLTVVVISRDILILLGVLILFLNRQDFTIRPSILSKVTTCLQLGTVFMVLLRNYFPISSQLGIYLFWVTGLLTVSSGLHYMRYWFRTIGAGVLSD
ncbi:MAG: CDP-alcohol phosphatidyltransferase family protein [Pseudomonadota bacterium]